MPRDEWMDLRYFYFKNWLKLRLYYLFMHIIASLYLKRMIFVVYYLFIYFKAIRSNIQGYKP